MRDVSYEMLVRVHEKNSERVLSFQDTELTGQAAIDYMNDLIDSSVFQASCAMRQGDNDVINMKPAQRRDFFMNLYDLSFTKEHFEITKRIDNENTKLVEIDTEIRMKRSQPVVEEKPYELYDEYKTDEDIASAKSEIKTIATDLDDAKKARENLLSIQADVKVYNDLEDQINRDTIELQNLGNKLQEDKGVAQQYADEQFVKTEIAKRMQAFEQDRDKIQNQLTTIAQNKLLSVDNTKQIELLKNNISTMNANLVAFNSIVDLGTKCPTCHQDIPESSRNFAKQSILDFSATDRGSKE